MSLKTRFTYLTLSQKQRIIKGSIAAILMLYISLVIYPLTTTIQNLEDQVQEDKELLTWVIATGNEIQQLRENIQTTSVRTGSLLSILDDTAKNYSWNNFITEMKEVENHRVEMTVSHLSFDELIIGIEKLWQKEHVKVTKISIQREQGLSTIEAKILFD